MHGPTSALYFNQGQCCCAGSRVFVEEKVHDKFVDKLAAMNKNRKVGDPFDPATEQGPQVDQAQFDKIMHYVDLRQEGRRQVRHRRQAASATRATSSSRPCSTSVTDDMSIAKDEIFGPVLSRAEVQGRSTK